MSYFIRKRDIRNRLFFYKKEKIRVIFKYIFFNLINRFRLKKGSTKFNKILFVCQKLYYTSNLKVGSKTKLLRRCLISNRNRSNLRLFGGLSRIVVRNFIHSGIIPGYKKAVW